MFYAVYCSMYAANIELYSACAVYCSMYAANIELYSAYAVYCSIYAANIELYSAYAVYCSMYAARIELYSACAVYCSPDLPDAVPDFHGIAHKNRQKKPFSFGNDVSLKRHVDIPPR